MPDYKILAEQIWLHLHDPEELDRRVAKESDRLRSDQDAAGLEEYFYDLEQIDSAVDCLMESKEFEKHKQTFSDAERPDDPELEEAVRTMTRTQRRHMTEEAKEEVLGEISADVHKLGQAIKQSHGGPDGSPSQQKMIH